MKIKNISPYGELDVPLLHRFVGADETVDVTPEQAEALLSQEANWAPADKAAKDALAALRAQDGPEDQNPADAAAGAAETGQEG